MSRRRRHKRISVISSLRYGWRLTLRHLNTLVPGTVAFYLPELAASWSLGFRGRWAVLTTAYKFLVGCWLLWHAVRLSDLETRSSRLHEPVLPAPGYLGRFLGSTLLFWGVLLAALWPVWRMAAGTWSPDPGQADWLLHPAFWRPDQAWWVLLCALAALPAGLWSVYGWFHGYYVADEGQGPWQSMLSSFHAVRGAFLKCTLFLALIGLINALGLALWMVGIFLAFPVTLMATTYVHLQLKRQTRIAGRGD
jgi:hypothetical protein